MRDYINGCFTVKLVEATFQIFIIFRSSVFSYSAFVFRLRGDGGIMIPYRITLSQLTSILRMAGHHHIRKIQYLGNMIYLICICVETDAGSTFNLQRVKYLHYIVLYVSMSIFCRTVVIFLRLLRLYSNPFRTQPSKNYIDF